jgi:hypothetical protein
MRCGNSSATTIGDDTGRTRTDDEGKPNSETPPRVVSHLCEACRLEQNKSRNLRRTFRFGAAPPQPWLVDQEADISCRLVDLS